MAALERAARDSAPCPSNYDLANMTGCITPKIGTQVIARLEAKGFITVRRGKRSRQVTIVATGESTAPMIPTTDRKRLDALADAMADGADLAAASRKLRISRAFAARLWKRVCADVGEPCN
jgi:DNA-binding MarR family transcriptional regulator